jgi:signal transduction histidine kinase
MALVGLAAYLFSETAFGRALDWPYLIFVAGSAVAALIWSIGWLAWSFARAAQRRDRWQYGLLLGALLVLVPALILPRLGTFFTAAPIPAFLYTFSYAGLLSVAVMAYAIVRFQIMPVRTRGLEYLALLAFCTLLAMAIALLFNNHSLFAATLAISLLTGLGLQWGGRLPIFVRVMRREQYDYATLAALERQISALQPVDELLQTLGVLLRRYLDVESLSAWLAAKDAGQLIWLQSGGGRAVVTVTSAQIAAMAEQLDPVAQTQPEASCYGALAPTGTTHATAVWASLTDHGELLGVLGLGPRWTGIGYDQRDLELIGALSRQVALAVANTRQLERLAEAAGKLQEAQERERLKIAREIHDTILQFLLVLTYGLDSIRERNPLAAAELEGWQDRISAQAAQLRSLLAYLRAPELLVQQGLAGALQAWLGQLRTMTPVAIVADLDAEVESLLSSDAKVAIYRVCREAVNNALKHAHASCIELRLWRAENGVTFCIRDDGIGFDLHSVHERGVKGYSSLQDMRMQLASVGGELTIQSGAEQGVQIRGVVVNSLNP